MKKIKSGKFSYGQKLLDTKSYFNVMVSEGQILRFICFWFRYRESYKKCPDPVASRINPSTHFAAVTEKLEAVIESFYSHNTKMVKYYSYMSNLHNYYVYI